MRLRTGRDFLRRARHNQPATVDARLRSEVDDVVRTTNHVHVVLDNQHRVTVVDQAVQRLDQKRNVIQVKPRRGLVQNEKRTGLGALNQAFG